MKLQKPKFWDNRKITFWSILLLPISFIYLSVIWLKKFTSIIKTKKKNYIPVICVGNIYIGGTGKTPLVKEIFHIIESLGKKPAFIKKTYNYLIDEIKMLKKTGETFECNNRNEGINSLIKSNHNVAILDDGYQDFSINPDFSILCFSSKQLIGNGFVIPSGPLRESFSAIKRASCLIINGEKNQETINFENKVKESFTKELPIFYSKYKIKNVEKFTGVQLTAFAGIGNPSNFFDLLRENNLNINNTFSFPDHYKYTKKDFDKIMEYKSTKLITTEKDYLRMSDEQKKICECVEVNLEIENIKQFESLINSYL